jgi:hypothetical protein
MAVGIATRTTADLLAERDAFPQPVPREMFVQWMKLLADILEKAINKLVELGVREIPDEYDSLEHFVRQAC